MNDRTVPPWAVPLLVFGTCGLVGMGVDVFGVLAGLDLGPIWFNRLDVLVAVAYTGVIGCLDAYWRRRV